jgi:protein-S-isoprenylcysteine O-methyltransferase Ste14
MSWNWLIRFLVIVALFIYLLGSRTLLRNRKKYRAVLESDPLNLLFVVIYNALCYVAVGIRSDPNVVVKPWIFDDMLVANWYLIFGQLLIAVSACFLIYAVIKRRAIGGQDTDGRLFTGGIYSFSRHPIYLGIILIALGISILRVNFDGMLVFPLVFVANFVQARFEEKYDVGERFRDEYDRYKKRTRMFGPVWFWIIMLILLMTPVVLILVRG